MTFKPNRVQVATGADVQKEFIRIDSAGQILGVANNQTALYEKRNNQSLQNNGSQVEGVSLEEAEQD
jgi:hypothetical protein